MKTIGVVMLDRRQKICADRLERSGYVVIRLAEQHDLQYLSQLDALVLPVRGIDSHHSIAIPSGELRFQDHYQQLKPDALLFTGIYNETLKTWNRKTIYLMEQEDVIEANALLTAQGVLAYILDHIDQGIREVTFDIIGYGHCGKHIAAFLRGLQAPVCVIRRSVDEQEDMPQETYEAWKQRTKFSDVVINTAPAMVIDETMIASLSHKPLFLDLASRPGGIDVQACEKYGVKCIVAPTLPAIYTPVSAGEIIAKAIEKEMSSLG